MKFHHRNDFPADPEKDFEHPTDENIPHGFNVLNLHTHGLNVSPEANGDNVLVQIHPGETFDYEIRIPEDHPSGTFWYHPHKHGSAFVHVASGMAGHLLIVDGPDDLRGIAEIAAAREVELLFQELLLTVDPLGEVDNHPLRSLFERKSYLQLTVNGMAIDEGLGTPEGTMPPVLPMRPGEVQRWRFSLTTHLQSYRFALHDELGNPIPLYIAAWDGVTQDALTRVLEVEMAPANRLDILVKAPPIPGTYPFKMLMTQFGENPIFTSPSPGVDELTVFNVEVSGQPLRMALPSRLNPPRQRLPHIDRQEIVRRRRIDFSVTGDVMFDMQNPPKFVADTREFFINDRKFSSQRIDHTMVLDTAEEWVLTNDMSINHPFHIHVNWFQVMRIVHGDGTIERPNSGIGRFQDTVDIPSGGQVVVRHRFENFPGKFPFHCHVIDHEDLGEMSLVEVITPEPVEALILPQQGGVLVSNDFDNRIIVRVPPDAVTKDTQLTLLAKAPPRQHPSGFLDLQRVFTLEARQSGRGLREFERAALIEIKYPRAIPDGKFDKNTVRLYRRLRGQWTTEGISVVARRHGLLVSTVNALGRFAVLAKPLPEALHL